MERTIDGFGIVTVWRPGTAVLWQTGPGDNVADMIAYDSVEEAEEAFLYVKNRSHYGSTVA